MALDGIYLSLIKKELSEILIGSRVDKIHQPSRESLVITFRTQVFGNRKLIMSANAGTARVHLTEHEPENPKAPPMFCMLMRKHIGSAKLVGIRQDGFERILFFDFETTDEFGDRVTLTLASEIMGRCSNIILISQDGRVIDSIKRVSEDMSRVRRVLPGIEYTLPPREKRLNPLDFDENTLRAALGSSPQELSKALIKAFEGISPVFAREAAFFSCRGTEKNACDLNEDDFNRLIYFLRDTAKKIGDGSNKYYILRDRDGVMKDFSFIKINQYGGLMFDREFDSPSALLDCFYSERDTLAQTKQRADDLFKLLLAMTERVRRRVSAQKIELKETENRDEYRIKGDLIMSNLWRLEKGMTEAHLENFYEGGSEISVALDACLTPSQNAQKYYSEYRKADTAHKMLNSLIKKGEAEMKYLDSVFDSLSRASTEAELTEIREELRTEGYLKSRSSPKQKSPKPLPPIEYRSASGFKILCGRSNRQNDVLTLKTADKSDLWFHVKDITGSHVILCTRGAIPTDKDLFDAAMIAAYNSSARAGSNVPVDYTLVKYVKKPSGAKPGMVIYTNQITLYVTPDKDAVAEIRMSEVRNQRKTEIRINQTTEESRMSE